MDGLLKVLIWRLEGSINQAEFRQIYHEWLRKKGILETPLATRAFFLNQTLPLGKDITARSSYFQVFSKLCRDLQGQAVAEVGAKMGVVEVREVL